MTDYVSERISTGNYEVKVFHPIRARTIKEYDGFWRVHVLRDGKWFRYTARQFSDKNSALNFAVGFLRAVSEQNGSGTASSSGPSVSTTSGFKFSRSDAASVLGVGVDASEEDADRAYKRLLRAVHPDVGGSTFLTQQLNAAREAFNRK